MKLTDFNYLDFTPTGDNEGYDRNDIVSNNIFSKPFKMYPGVLGKMAMKICILKFDKHRTTYEIAGMFGIDNIDVERILQVCSREMYNAASVDQNLKLDISEEVAQKMIFYYLRKVEANNLIV